MSSFPFFFARMLLTGIPEPLNFLASLLPFLDGSGNMLC